MGHYAGGETFDVSDNVFQIFGDHWIEVSYPNGGEIWYIGIDDTTTIRWTHSWNFDSFDVLLSLDRGIVPSYDTLVTGLLPHAIDWCFNAPLLFPPSDSCVVKVVGHFGGDYVYDRSNDYFSIIIPITLTLTPHNPPIQIPAGGGSFQFDVLIENIISSPVTFDGWTEAILPSGSPYPIFLRTDLNLPVGGSLSREINQFVPGGAPAGVYSYNAYVGTHPDIIIDSDSFPFEKLPGDDTPTYDFGWALFGWDGEETPIIAAPKEFVLQPAYPNPFNPETQLTFSMPEAGEVSLVIYDVQGREIVSLINGFQPAGIYQRTFDASELSSGVYFACLKSEGFSQTRKMLLVK